MLMKIFESALPMSWLALSCRINIHHKLCIYIGIKMGGLKILCLLFGVLFSITISCNGKSDTCFRLYEEGGVPAVLQSSECSYEYIHPKSFDQTTKCQSASLKGRREYQEDRVLCDLDMQIDLPGNSGQELLKIGLAAVFDGHGGKEASELAAQLLPYYFQLHSRFLSQKELELFEGEHDMTFPLEQEVNSFDTRLGRYMNKSKTIEVIREAILLTIHDIDSTFSQVAMKKHLLAGTTATIALLVDNELLIANVGDSKALLCSEMSLNSEGTSASTSILHAIELTKDHHPDRDDEKARIEAAGGFVSLSGVFRVNGILAVSRAIGDVYLKRYGVIAEPEVADWRQLNQSDVFLVVASDGIFEELSTQEVCTLLHDAESQDKDQKSWRSTTQESSSLAERILNMAYEKGSYDNLSVIVIPLRSLRTSE